MAATGAELLTDLVQVQETLAAEAAVAEPSITDSFTRASYCPNGTAEEPMAKRPKLDTALIPSADSSLESAETPKEASKAVSEEVPGKFKGNAGRKKAEPKGKVEAKTKAKGVARWK